ncbi:MAG TPA: zf-HC2 domain-containing protein [Nocardioides sp.]|nr:zf-HC2 domain-containing protein [Nocardioides sp.]
MATARPLHRGQSRQDVMADLTCQELVELVSDYLEGALDEVTAERFDQHLALCAGCQTYLEQLKESVSLMGEIGVESLSEEMQATLMRMFRDFPR